MSPVRVCLGCGNLTRAGSRCPNCKPARQLNGWRWTQQRLQHLANNPICVICGTTANLEVHHRIPLADGGTDHPSNLETRCRTHHHAAH